MKEFVKSITSPYEKELIETRRNQHGRCHKRRKNRSMHRVPRGHRRAPGGGRK